MKSRQVFATLMVAILVLGTMAAVGLASPMTFVKPAVAQGANVTITTSADAHGGSFFGGAVQVIVRDPDADDSDTIEDITVEIDADPDSGSGDSGSFTIFETSKSSGRFEFYLAHIDSVITAASIDPINPRGVADYPVPVDEAAFITFGTGGNFAADIDLFEDGSSFDITVGDETVTIDYDTVIADLTLDRDNEEYGSTSIVRLSIVDQDANLNPTEADDYTLDATSLAALFSIDNGEFSDDAVFEETGDNTGIFEAELQLTDVDADTTDEFVIAGDDTTVQMTLNDADDYGDQDADTDLNESDSTATSDLSFTINNVDGDISDFGVITFGTELKLTITDNDQNIDSDDDDTIPDALEISTGGGDDEIFTLEETGDNTGIFEPDTSNNEIRITFCSEDDIIATTCPVDGNGIIELTPDDATDDITVTYIDPISDDTTDDPFTQTFEVSLARPTISVPETVGINDDFTVTITDANLNDNPRTRDSYTIVLDGPSTDLPFFRGGESIGIWVTLDVEIEGGVVDFDDAITETMTETGINTGIFQVSFDMAEILDSAGVAGIDDGDEIEFTINDLFDDQSREASDSLSIGRASTAIDFSRTSAPIPPEAGSSVEDALGDTVFVTLVITDADENTQTNTENSIAFVFEDDAAPGEPSFIVEIDADGTSNDETITSAADYAGSLLEDILPGLDSLVLFETGKSTGVFDEELEFVNGGLDADDWQDLEVSITYIDSEGDEEEAGITFRGNDGTIEVSADIVQNGATLTVTIQDEDLNLDDDTEEEFTSTIDTDEPYLVAVETDDDDICDETGDCPSTETFRETGTDTGIFTATFVVGTDIPITDDDGEEIFQASVIRFTYNDEIDSSGGGGDEIELEVPVVTGTGAISVAPELVGPATEITVTITDTDLNKDARSSDDYEPTDPDDDEFFVSFRSDRNEVGRASPDLEETGANTGIFTFTIELITDEGACEDDDLDDSKFDATGGSSPSIGACPGDLISIRYEDAVTESGRSATISEIVEVRSFDPEFAADKESYAVGDKILVTISDPDANRKPDIADTLRDIRVTSDSDRVGEEMSAIETGRDTGVFRLSIQTSSGTSGGAITVKTGDNVNIEYTDAFPADFEEEENDKDFVFTVQIGAGAVGTGATTASPPAAQTPTGQPVTSIAVGQQIVLSTTVANNQDASQPFVALVEVRNSNDVTVYLAWQTGTLSANGRANIGLSWTPDIAGNYDVRTFVISSLTSPQILSTVSESSITVS